jgi:hypothetical protein
MSERNKPILAQKTSHRFFIQRPAKLQPNKLIVQHIRISQNAIPLNISHQLYFST